MNTLKTLKTIEFDKILAEVASYAVLDDAKNEILSFLPVSDLSEAEFLLNKTNEAYALLYTHNVSGIYYFSKIEDELDRVDKGGVLNIAEILKVAQNLKSARIIKTAIESVNDEKITYIPSLHRDCINVWSLKRKYRQKSYLKMNFLTTLRQNCLQSGAVYEI